MITTVTLNVSVDKAYYITGSIKPGTVARVATCSNTAGGKGLNVARAIDLCEEEVIATGFVGGFNGEYVKAMLKKDGIKESFTTVKSETRSCINIIDDDRTSTEFLEPGAELTTEEVNQFMNDFDQMIEQSDVITISGSIPKGVPTDIYRTLIEKIKDKNKQVILDTSGALLLEGMKAGPTMIKPNEEELEAILNIKIANRQQTIDAAKQLLNYGIQYVVVSLGSDGAMVICNEGVYHGKPPKLNAINTVGCGDTMVGAFAVALKRKLPIKEALTYAISVSAANAIHEKTGCFSLDDVAKIQPLVKFDVL